MDSSELEGREEREALEVVPESLPQTSESRLRQYTPARVGLGRVGHAPPLLTALEFQLAHAEARDAVWKTPDWAALERGILALDTGALGGQVLRLKSRAADRAQYLLRPDLGRRLHPESRARLEDLSSGNYDVALVLADGLSGAALDAQALGLLGALLPLLESRGYSLAPMVLVQGARVALGDEVGEVLGAKTVLVLIGERPGLSSADSLGLYLTHHPKVGRTDADRNCISNVQSQGIRPLEAAQKLLGLLEGARKLGRSGVDLKPLEESVGGRLGP